MTDKDRRIVDFLLAHGVTTLDELQSRLERSFLAMLCTSNHKKTSTATLRRQAAEEVASILADFGSRDTVPVDNHRWQLHCENFPQKKLHDAAFLLTSKN